MNENETAAGDRFAAMMRDTKTRIAEQVQAAQNAGERYEVASTLAAVTVYRDQHGDDMFVDVLLDDGEALSFTVYRDPGEPLAVSPLREGT